LVCLAALLGEIWETILEFPAEVSLYWCARPGPVPVRSGYDPATR
jgi:hypothetical protein